MPLDCCDEHSGLCLGTHVQNGVGLAAGDAGRRLGVRTHTVTNAAHMKAVPGRKSDVRDAEWIAQLLEHGLLRPSFVPPPEIRRLRMLTRYRVQLMGDRRRDIVRLELMLELSRSGARCPDCSGSVSPDRSPNPPCVSRRNGLHGNPVRVSMV